MVRFLRYSANLCPSYAIDFIVFFQLGLFIESCLLTGWIVADRSRPQTTRLPRFGVPFRYSFSRWPSRCFVPLDSDYSFCRHRLDRLLGLHPRNYVSVFYFSPSRIWGNFHRANRLELSWGSIRIRFAFPFTSSVPPSLFYRMFFF